MNDIQHRCSQTIAQGALTNSKRPSTFVEGIYPTHVYNGFGCHLRCRQDGRNYIDFICGLGTNILGYGEYRVRNAVMAALIDGNCLSLSSEKEIEYAEMVKLAFPAIERMKFLKTGTEAAMASLRIARAYTQKKYVLSDGYHGWSDEFVSLTEPHLGVNSYHDTAIYKLHDVLGSDHRDDILKNTAAIIVEPVITDNSMARINYLHTLRDLCDKFGIVLIFDEIITGFRYQKLSVSNAHNITPDILLLGKAAANGFPLSIVGGKKEIMECGEYFVSSTFAGDQIALTAAIKTLQILKNGWEINTLWEEGGVFRDRFNEVGKELIWIDGYNTRGVLKGKCELTKALFMQEMCKAGILFGPSWFYCLAHKQYTDIVLETMKTVMDNISNNRVKMEGALPRSPFAQRVRDGG